MSKGKIFGLVILLIVILAALDLGTGYLGVLKTKTVGKAEKNADREVFEQTQSFVESNRISAAKDYKEWLKSDDGSRKALENLAAHRYANFDEQKYMYEGPVKVWIYRCKNGMSPGESMPTTKKSNPF